MSAWCFHLFAVCTVPGGCGAHHPLAEATFLGFNPAAEAAIHAAAEGGDARVVVDLCGEQALADLAAFSAAHPNLRLGTLTRPQAR